MRVGLPVDDMVFPSTAEEEGDAPSSFQPHIFVTP